MVYQANTKMNENFCLKKVAFSDKIAVHFEVVERQSLAIPEILLITTQPLE